MPGAGNLGDLTHVHVYDYDVLFLSFPFQQLHYLIECIDYESRLASACYIVIHEFPFIFFVYASNFVTRGGWC